MSRRAPLALALFAGAPIAVQAQSFTSDLDMTIHMTWREASSSGGLVPNPNGVLDPGEYALISIDSVHFTNVGSVANFSPPIGTFTSGLIEAFGTAYLDLNGSGGTVGTFNHTAPFGVQSPWRFDGDGTVNPTSDGIINLHFGQLPTDPGHANTNVPAGGAFRMLWQPASYASRTVTFTEVGAAIAGDAIASVYLDLNGTSGPGSGTIGGAAFLTRDHLHLNGINIPIAPAPPTAAVAAALLVPLRRRRAPAEDRA
jgi:hypothetical protein